MREPTEGIEPTWQYVKWPGQLCTVGAVPPDTRPPDTPTLPNPPTNSPSSARCSCDSTLLMSAALSASSSSFSRSATLNGSTLGAGFGGVGGSGGAHGIGAAASSNLANHTGAVNGTGTPSCGGAPSRLQAALLSPLAPATQSLPNAPVTDTIAVGGPTISKRLARLASATIDAQPRLQRATPPTLQLSIEIPEEPAGGGGEPRAGAEGYSSWPPWMSATPARR